MSTAVLAPKVSSSPTWQDVVLSFAPPSRRTERARRLLARVPLLLIVALQVALSLRLSNAAFADEALYVQAGHDLIGLALHGTPEHFYYGTYFSGLPAAYPIVAGALDSVGGLILVRLFSTVCMVVATLCVHRMSRRLFGHRAALLSALVFVLSGSVLFLGRFATYDAPSLALVGLAACIAVTRRSILSGIPVGVLLTLAGITKYAGLAFIPFVLALVLVSASSVYVTRAIVRTAVAAATVIALLAGGYLLDGSAVRAGVEFTTTSRKALDYKSMPFLLETFGRDVGLALLLAIAGVLLLVMEKSLQKSIICLVLLGAGLALPAGQFRIHEYTSFDKHTAFTALFFAVPAGLALDWVLTRNVRYKLLAGGLVWLVLINGLNRSKAEYDGWPSSITTIIAAVEAHAVPGEYMSFDGQVDRYYMRQHTDLTWDIPYGLFRQGVPAVEAAVRSHKYEGFVYCYPGTIQECHKSIGKTNAYEATMQQVIKVLQSDPYYHLVATRRAWQYEGSYWYFWQRADPSVPAAPPVSAASLVARAPTTVSAATLLSTRTGAVTLRSQPEQTMVFRPSGVAARSETRRH